VKRSARCWHRKDAMRRRCFDAAAIVLFILGAAMRIHPAPPRPEEIRQTAWKLAKAAIQESGPRRGIPEFVNRLTAREIYPCVPPGGSRQAPGPRDFFDESFHYNAKAALRMCEPLVRAGGAPSMDRALSFWEHSNPKPRAMDPPFPPGAQLSAAFWNPVRLPADPTRGKIVALQVRAGERTSTRRIRITIPGHDRAGSESCGPPKASGDPAAPDAQDVSLDDFFWVRLGAGERYNGASCGDFAVLVAFHLVHKDHGKWLWTTFWWDLDSIEFGRGRPASFQGAGEHPKAWANYAMDASTEATSVIFNPWRIEERGSNCAKCHAEVTVHPGANPGESISFDSVTAAQAHFK